MVSVEPGELKRIIRRRRITGADRFDEVWDGVYVMAPLADNEHQGLGGGLTIALASAFGSTEHIRLFPGCNVSDQPTRWKHNYRVPDVAVFLPGNPAEDRGSHWFGGPDFAVEIRSRYDKSRQKFGFYKKVGVRELLLIDRRPWALELYSSKSGNWALVGRSDLDSNLNAVASDVLGLSFQLVAGTPRPRIEVKKKGPQNKWFA